MKIDPYDILGVDKNADKEMVKKAHRKKAMENHPDKGGNAETTSLINVARDILLDDDRRKKWDETGELSNPIDDREKKATVIVINFINDIIDNWHDGIFDRFNELACEYCDHIKKGIIESREKIAVLTLTLSKIDNVKDKFKNKKGEGVNIFAITINKKISEIKGIIGEREKHIEICERAIEILKNYEYK